jgi:nucleoside-diphosphate-sugar epimerase
MKVIMATGGSGFLGKHIVKHLQEQCLYCVLAPTHEELDLLDTKRVEEYINEYMPNIIIHCATVHNIPEAIYRNTLMYHNLYRMCDSYEKMLNISSGAVYDITRNIVCATEKEVLYGVPKEPYGYSKYLNTMQTLASPNIIDLYLFGIFGKGEFSTRFTANSIIRIKNGLGPLVEKDRLMSFLYIEDFLCILDKFITRNGDIYHTYNVVPDEIIGLQEFGEKLRNIMEGKVPTKVSYRMDHAPAYTGDNSLLKETFPDIVFTSLDTALIRYLEEGIRC